MFSARPTFAFPLLPHTFRSFPRPHAEFGKSSTSSKLLFYSHISAPRTEEEISWEAAFCFFFFCLTYARIPVVSLLFLQAFL